MNYNKLPQELIENKNFGIYRLDKKEEEKNGHKYDKKPINCTSKEGWKSLPEALRDLDKASKDLDKASKGLKALDDCYGEPTRNTCGYLLAYFLNGDGIHFLDLDNIRNDVQECKNKRVSEDNLIKRVMLMLGHTYTEYSSSENGVHIFFRVEEKLPHKNKAGDIELYDEKRGIALTGNTLFGVSWPVATISVETYKQLIKMLGLEKPKEKPRAAAAVTPKRYSTQVPNNWTEQDAWNTFYTKGDAGKRNEAIQYMNGNYTDHSSALYRVCYRLVFPTRGDASMIYNMVVDTAVVTDKDWQKGHFTEYKNSTMLDVCIRKAISDWMKDHPSYSNWVA